MNSLQRILNIGTLLSTFFENKFINVSKTGKNLLNWQKTNSMSKEQL